MSIQFGVVRPIASTPSIDPNCPKLSTMECKAVVLSLNFGPTAKKRPSFSQSKSSHEEEIDHWGKMK